jgi:hypothetical protein
MRGNSLDSHLQDLILDVSAIIDDKQPKDLGAD